MKISFNGIQLLRYSNPATRNEAKALEEESPNGHGGFWTSVALDKDKNSSDLLILSGFDLESAIENMGDNQTVDEYVRENSDRLVKKAKVYDYRELRTKNEN